MGIKFSLRWSLHLGGVMKEEIWVPIKDFELTYEINWDGVVRSVDRMVKKPSGLVFRKGRVLRRSKNSKGSDQVVLVKKCGKRKTIRIYEIFMEAFSNNINGPAQAEKFLGKEDNSGRGKFYEFLDPNGDYIKIQNLSSFCEENGLHNSNMCQVHSGKLKSCSGWKKFTVGK